MNIYFDESGNVELGIRDNSQLFFTIGSHNACKELCNQARTKVYGDKGPNELKFQDMKRSDNKINKIASICKILLENEVQIRTYTIYKPFYLFNSFLTLCQDEILEQQNIETGDENFIKYRRNFVWFYTLFTIGPGFLKGLLDRYQKFILEKDKTSLRSLIRYLETNQNDPLNAFKDIKDYLNSNQDYLINLVTKDHSSCNNKLSWLNESSWIYLPLSCSRFLIKFWGKYNHGDLDIYHDQSIPLEKRADFFQLMPDVDNVPINSFQFIDSTNSIEIQLADIIAGTFNFWYEKILLKRLGKIDKKLEKKFNQVDQIIRLTPNNWHIHLIPDIDCMNVQQRYIVESYGRLEQHVDPFCFEVFSQ